jgi:tRNA nucleotidyltransferase (CCA-adding enzyme)
MKTDLDHLPAAKQRELAHVVRVLFEEFEREIGLATQGWKKRGRILKVILYGSHARGDWVDSDRRLHLGLRHPRHRQRRQAR